MWISIKVFPGVRIGGRIGGRRRKRVKVAPAIWVHGPCTVPHRSRWDAEHCELERPNRLDSPSGRMRR